MLTNRINIEYRGKFKASTLFIKFMRFLAIKLPSRNLEFDVMKGRPKPKRLHSGQYLSIKHPFLRFMNLGRTVEKCDMDKLVGKI